MLYSSAFLKVNNTSSAYSDCYANLAIVILFLIRILLYVNLTFLYRPIRTMKRIIYV